MYFYYVKKLNCSNFIGLFVSQFLFCYLTERFVFSLLCGDVPVYSSYLEGYPFSFVKF